MKIADYFCTTGLLVGAFFLALSLTPTLVPRTAVLQGMVSGVALAAGYGLGVLGEALWAYLQLPRLPRRARLKLKGAAAMLCLAVTLLFMWQWSTWQATVRMLVDMPPGDGFQPLTVGAITLLLFLVLWALGWKFNVLWRRLSGKLGRYVPHRVSVVLGLLLSFYLFWLIVDGVLFAALMRSADTSYEQVDAFIEPDLPPPTDTAQPGSAASVLAWEDMGREGRRFVAGRPSADSLGAFLGEPATQPRRIYVGMHAAEDVETRARLALEELLRVDAFDRSVLVLITPTGTGWVDPPSIETIEYLHRGDVASVAAQYSYLPSPLALMMEADYGAEMAQALFREIYGYWTTLPPDERPDLYLNGLSLGALNSDRSFDFFDIINDPFQGALWVGPPFRQRRWQTVTDQREPGSPAWLPRFRDDAVVRFMNQQGGFDLGRAPWGSFRIGFLQYASDPITFFSPGMLTQEPEWLQDPRGPDVSDDLRWYPVITMLQLAVDMLAGTSAPRGYGHEYAASHYIDAWYALTEPEGWTNEALDRLRLHLATEDEAERYERQQSTRTPAFVPTTR